MSRIIADDGVMRIDRTCGTLNSGTKIKDPNNL